MIQRAGKGSREDLESLCRQYWYPLYAYIRRGGDGPEDAEDLTQAFVSKLIEKQWVEQASDQDCTFRSFLLIRLKRFLNDEREKGHALKRGGGVAHVPIHIEGVEERYTTEPVDAGMAPDKLFDRAWASSLMEHAREMLRLGSPNQARSANLLRFSSALLGTRIPGFIKKSPSRSAVENAGSRSR